MLNQNAAPVPILHRADQGTGFYINPFQGMLCTKTQGGLACITPPDQPLLAPGARQIDDIQPAVSCEIHKRW